MLFLLVRLSALAIGLSYATVPTCQQSQLTQLHDRMNQMISALYSSPFLTKSESSSSASTTPSAPATSSDYQATSVISYESQPSNYSPTASPQVVFVAPQLPPLSVSQLPASQPTVTVSSTRVPRYYAPAESDYYSYSYPSKAWPSYTEHCQTPSYSSPSSAPIPVSYQPPTYKPHSPPKPREYSYSYPEYPSGYSKPAYPTPPCPHHPSPYPSLPALYPPAAAQTYPAPSPPPYPSSAAAQTYLAPSPPPYPCSAASQTYPVPIPHFYPSSYPPHPTPYPPNAAHIQPSSYAPPPAPYPPALAHTYPAPSPSPQPYDPVSVYPSQPTYLPPTAYPPPPTAYQQLPSY